MWSDPAPELTTLLPPPKWIVSLPDAVVIWLSVSVPKTVTELSEFISTFSILNKERREIDYIKGVYKRKIQAEIESYKDPEDEDKRDTIQAQDVLMLDRISI